MLLLPLMGGAGLLVLALVLLLHALWLLVLYPVAHFVLDAPNQRLGLACSGSARMVDRKV